VSNSSQTYPPRLLRYITVIVAATVPVAVGAVVQIGRMPPDAGTALGVGLFFAAALAAEYKPVPLDEHGSRTVSLAFVFLLSTQFLFGWQFAVLGAIGTMTVVQLHDRAPLLRSLFNASSCGLAAFVSAAPGFLLGWTVSPHNAEALTLLVFLGGAAYVITNVVTVAIAVSLYTGQPIRDVLDDYVRHSGPAFAIMAFIAALATSLWMINPRLELLLAGPLFALALYQRYAYRSVMATRDAETDALTSLRNHRSFQTDLREALAMGASTRSQLSLVLVDIDNFKSINDRFGHPVGDQVLATLARLMRDEYGDAESYRIGGGTRGCGRPAFRTPSRSPSAPASPATRAAPPTARSCCGWPTAPSTGPRTTARTAPVSTARRWCGSTRRRSWPSRPSGMRG
jgi:GGDEF domain-containing protein